MTQERVLGFFSRVLVGVGWWRRWSELRGRVTLGLRCCLGSEGWCGGGAGGGWGGVGWGGALLADLGLPTLALLPANADPHPRTRLEPQACSRA